MNDLKADLEAAIANMEETLALCDEAKRLGYPGASEATVKATRKLTETRLKEFKAALARLPELEG